MEMLVVDQGPEFTGTAFREFWMEHGVLVHFTDSRSPWQNGSTERAGGIFKEILEKVVHDMCIMIGGISGYCPNSMRST